ncbi:UNVERIFIED_CONTAM: hypothetical protein Sindi_0447800 [Sesamum indicum]
MRTRNDKPREPKYQPKYHNYTHLTVSQEKALMLVENVDLLKWSRHTRYTPSKKFSNKYCRFHLERRHDTEECFQLKYEIERLVRQGYFRDRIPSGCKVGKDEVRRSRSRSRDRNPGLAKKDKAPANRNNAPTREGIRRGQGKDVQGDWGAINDPIVIKLDIANFTVHKVLVDNGSSTDIIFKTVIDKMGLENAHLEPVKTSLVGFGGSEVASLGMIKLPVSMGVKPKCRTLMIKFLVIDTPFAYNVILGRPGLNLFRAVISTYHMKMKFPTEHGIGEKRRRVGEDAEPQPYEADHMKPSKEYKAVQLVEGDQGKTTKIGPKMGETETTMVEFLRTNANMFAWSPSDFKAINPEVIVHRLNVDPTVRPVQQKKRSFGIEKSKIIEQEVSKLLKAGCDLSAFGKQDVPRAHWAFNIMRSYGMKLNPDKCTFGVGGDKFFRYMVSKRGIEANPEKIQAIMSLCSPTTVNEVQKYFPIAFSSSLTMMDPLLSNRVFILLLL